jgi:hypothetical protein
MKTIYNFISFSRITDIARDNNYQIYLDNYKLNIWGIRSSNHIAGKFDDDLLIFHFVNGNMVANVFNCTTDPSDHFLLNPINPMGTAIVKPGQYVNVWKYGFHKNDRNHPALVQVAPITVYRDANRDVNLDTEGVKTDTGIFGINLHRAHESAIAKFVGRYSAGCLVVPAPNDYSRILNLIERSIVNNKTDLFTYTLVTDKDFIK